MQEAIETIDYKGHNINIFQDDNTESPDDWHDENLFLVGFHRDFTVNREGLDQDTVSELFSSEPEESYKETIDGILKKYHVLPLEAYIHGGVKLSIASEGNFPDRRWDVSLLGAIFIAKEEARTKKEARRLADGLIETWNDYLAGNVYGYVIDEDGESCWGFYGDIYKNMYMHGKRKDGFIIQEAKAAIDAIDPKEYANNELQKRIDKLSKWEMSLPESEREAVKRSVQSAKKTLEKMKQ